MKDVTYHNLRTKIPHTKTEYNMEISISPFDYSKLSSHFLGNYCHRQWHGPRFNDARLACLNSKYFHNKQVLEVGCNDG